MGTLVVQPSAKDTRLEQNHPDSAYGSDVSLNIADREGISYHPILEFDVSELPADQTLLSATLELYYYAYIADDPVGKAVLAYKLTRTDWVEAQATWNIYKTGSNWTTPGGDYVTSDPDGGTTDFPADYGWMSWSVLAIVNDAYAGSIPAEFLVRFETEEVPGFTLASFYSNNYTDNTDLCPKLTIVYEAAAPPAGRSSGYIIG